MQVLNDVLGRSRAQLPPMRDIDGILTQVRARSVPNMHAFTNKEANAEAGENLSGLPAPKQWLLSRLSEAECAELIEKHINYVDEEGTSVQLPAKFVEHYLQRHDGALPIVVAIATLPLVLADGTFLMNPGLDRERGIAFQISQEVLAIMPRPEECTAEAVAEAMRFLRDEWLCDVTAKPKDKCILIAAALTLIERSILPDRPVFFVTAGRRGGGKTTTLTMLIEAVTGMRPAAAAWSPSLDPRPQRGLRFEPVEIWRRVRGRRFPAGEPADHPIFWPPSPSTRLRRSRTAPRPRERRRRLAASSWAASVAGPDRRRRALTLGGRGPRTSRSGPPIWRR
jgi:hypothetical protein